MTFAKALILYNFSAFHLNPSILLQSPTLEHVSFENDSYIDISTYIP